MGPRLAHASVSGLLEERRRAISSGSIAGGGPYGGVAGGYATWEYYTADDRQRLLARLLEQHIAQRIVPNAPILFDGEVTSSRDKTPGWKWILFGTPLGLAGVPIGGTWESQVTLRVYAEDRYIDSVVGIGVCTGDVYLYRTGPILHRLEACAIDNAIANAVRALEVAAGGPPQATETTQR